MARVTIENCLEQIDNTFELVIAASKRARALSNGKEALVDWGNDKPTVVALREIAAGLVDDRGNPVQSAVDEIAADQNDPEQFFE